MTDDTSKKRVLYVEDDPSICELFKASVETHGYIVETAATGAEGLFRHSKSPYHLIAIDYQLPDMTGIDLARRIIIDNPDIPLLMITGQGDQRIATEALTLGVSNYIAKDDSDVYLELIPSILAQLFERADSQTEQKLAQISLEQSEKKYRVLVANSPVCIHEIDLDGKLISMNPAGLRMMGVQKPEEVCGLKYLDVPLPEDKERVSKLMQKAIRGKGSLFEFSAQGETGPLHFSSSFEPIKNEDGVVIKLMGVTQDVTERIDREQELVAKTSLLETVLDSMTDGISVIDKNLNVVAFNGNFLKLLDFPSDRFHIGDKFEKFIRFNAERGDYGAGDPEELVAERLKLAGAAEPHEFERTRPNGTTLRIVGNPLPNGGFVTTYSDITQKKSADEALKLSEQRFRDIAETSSDWIWELDEQLRISYLSDQYEDILGVNIESVLGTTTLENPTNTHSDPTLMALHLNDLQAHREIRDFVYPKTNRKTETIVWVSVSGKPVIDDTGRFIGYRGTGSNITKRKDAENLLSEASTLAQKINDELISKAEELTAEISQHRLTEQYLREAKAFAEAASRSKSEFLANMSHELRTPLNAIIGFSQIWCDEVFGKIENSKYTEYATDINVAGTHLLQIVSDILDLSKIEAGEMELELEEFELKETIESCMNLLENKANISNIALKFSISHASGLLVADKRMFKQVLINILSNALKFTPEGGTVCTTVDQNELLSTQIVVSDTGIGIPAEKLLLILEPFGQVRDSSHVAHEGTGLGLPIAKRMMEQHGGTIAIKSKVDEGTRVIIAYPGNLKISSPFCN